MLHLFEKAFTSQIEWHHVGVIATGLYSTKHAQSLSHYWFKPIVASDWTIW